jgi:hypothetical protein
LFIENKKRLSKSKNYDGFANIIPRSALARRQNIISPSMMPSQINRSFDKKFKQSHPNLCQVLIFGVPAHPTEVACWFKLSWI